MKTSLRFLALAFTSLASALAVDPPVSVTVEPQESNQMIYAPMGALSGAVAPTGRLWFSLKIRNDGPATLTLTSIRVTLTGVDVSIPRSSEIIAGATVGTSLADDEIITVPHPAAATLTLRLYFSGNPTPKTLLSPLAPYTPAVAGGYLYPADEGDIGPNEYFSASQTHGPGGQMWGADWQVYRIVAQGDTTTVRAGGDSALNEDRLGWGVPIRAIADGTVLRTSTGWIDNPAPGKRAFQLMSEYDGEVIANVKVTRLGATRATTLQRLPSGQVQLTAWDILDVGRQIVRLGSSPLIVGETASALAIDALTGTRVAGIVRLTGSTNQRVIVWDLSADGATVEHAAAPVDGAAVNEVALMKMSSSRFATAVRTVAGNLQVGVWEIDGAGLHQRAVDTAEAATFVCVSALSSTRLAASFRTAGGLLKVIVWDYIAASMLLDRQGEETGEAITRVAASVGDDSTWERKRWITAVRTSPAGLLKLIRWDASEDGSIVAPEHETTMPTPTIQNTGLAIAPGTGSSGYSEHLATVSVLAGGTFQINGWGHDPTNSPTSYEFSAQNTAGTVTHVSLDELEDTEFIAAARTTGGALKLMTWHWADGGGNSVIMLHGDCRVLYAHFQADSVDTAMLQPGATVRAGQVLGRMGNSGASGGPHTHINSDRIEDGHTLEELIALEAAYAVPVIGQRPMPFSGARAMQLSQIDLGGEGNAANSFATLNNQGMYETRLGIRPRLDTRYVDRTTAYAVPTGRKEPQPGLFATGGPFRTIVPALGGVPSGGRLYIRGGSYDETFTFTTPMTVRRYDHYDLEGAAVIGK